MGDQAIRADQLWQQKVQRAQFWQNVDQYRTSCRDAHRWAVEMMGATR